MMAYYVTFVFVIVPMVGAGAEIQPQESHYILPSAVSPTYDVAFCSRELSREAAAIIWNDIYTMLDATDTAQFMHPNCPLNVSKNLYGTEESWKTMRRLTHWECGQCKRAFKSEFYLDYHVHNNHVAAEREAFLKIGSASGYICLADLCGMLGCPSLGRALTDFDTKLGESWHSYIAEAEITNALVDEEEEDDGSDEAEDNAANEDNEAPFRISNNPGIRGAHINPNVHHTAVSGKLTEAQQQYRRKCASLLEQCFEAPTETPETIDSPSLLRASNSQPAAARLQATIAGLKAIFCEETVTLNLNTTQSPSNSTHTGTLQNNAAAIVLAKARETGLEANSQSSFWVMIGTIAGIFILVGLIAAGIFYMELQAHREAADTPIAAPRMHARSTAIQSSNRGGLRARRHGFKEAEAYQDNYSASSSDDDNIEPEYIAMAHALARSENDKFRSTISRES